MSIEMDQIYSTLAFLHTLAAMGLSAGMAIEAVAVRGLGQAGRPQPAREWIAVYRIALRLSMASMVLLLLAGLVMMAVRRAMVGPRVGHLGVAVRPTSATPG